MILVFWLANLSMSLAEEPNVLDKAQHNLIYSGLDLDAAIMRTSAASEQSSQTLIPVTIFDLVGNEHIQLQHLYQDKWITDKIILCSGAKTSNAHIRTLTQTADNFLSYYDLDQASTKIALAEDAVHCLQELFNPEDIRQMYFIKGILEQNKGNKDESIQAFSSAIRVKPDLQWNTFYSPDAKPYFDLAKDEFVQLKSIKLDIIPKEAASSLWINGAPLLNVDNPEILEGTNIIQIIGLDTHTYELTIPSDTDGVRIIAPSTLPTSALSWVGNDEKQLELAFVLDSVMSDQTVFLHNQGQVWKSDLGTHSWSELKVSRFTEVRLNAKQIFGHTLLWSGATTSVVALGFGLYQYSTGFSAYRNSQTTQDWDTYLNNASALESVRGPYRVSLVTFGSGLLLSGLGYTIAY